MDFIWLVKLEALLLLLWWPVVEWRKYGRQGNKARW